MKEEYCQSCGQILRFPESARKVICSSCDSEWTVVRTGSIINLAPMGTMQTRGDEETLQKKLKDVQRQALIKEEHFRTLQREIESIVVEFTPVPILAKIGAGVVTLFFLAGAAGAWFFKQPFVIAVALVAMSAVPIVAVVMFGRQINQAERAKLIEKKELIVKLAQLKRELAILQQSKTKLGEDAIIEE